MPTELEELVGFIASPNAKIRLLATENLVPFSASQPALFKTDDLTPIKHLKFLIRDHPKIAEHALSCLINLTAEKDVLENVATDERFIGILLGLLVDPDETNANLMAMLLANLTKWDGLKSLLDRKQTPPEKLKSDDRVINQLMDLFVKGADGTYNKHADYDYLSYVFADLSKHDEIRQYFVNRQDYDDVIPINKIKVFTEHKSDIRRKGVASIIKNAAFDVPSHPAFLDEDDVNILPYILLPIMGGEVYPEEEALEMLTDLQLLPPDKQRDPDSSNILTHLETLTLLTTTRAGRDFMRSVSVYPIIRETHLRVNDEAVQEACERLVNVLMRDEADPKEIGGGAPAVAEEEEDDIVEV